MNYLVVIFLWSILLVKNELHFKGRRSLMVVTLLVVSGLYIAYGDFNLYTFMLIVIVVNTLFLRRNVLHQSYPLLRIMVILTIINIVGVLLIQFKIDPILISIITSLLGLTLVLIEPPKKHVINKHSEIMLVIFNCIYLLYTILINILQYKVYLNIAFPFLLIVLNLTYFMLAFQKKVRYYDKYALVNQVIANISTDYFFNLSVKDVYLDKMKSIIHDASSQKKHAILNFYNKSKYSHYSNEQTLEVLMYLNLKDNIRGSQIILEDNSKSDEFFRILVDLFSILSIFDDLNAFRFTSNPSGDLMIQYFGELPFESFKNHLNLYGKKQKELKTDLSDFYYNLNQMKKNLVFSYDGQIRLTLMDTN